jgi:hypothetical protein
MDRADMRALLWLIGAVAFVVGGFLVAHPVAVMAAGYVLMRWTR